MIGPNIPRRFLRYTFQRKRKNYLINMAKVRYGISKLAPCEKKSVCQHIKYPSVQSKYQHHFTNSNNAFLFPNKIKLRKIGKKCQ